MQHKQLARNTSSLERAECHIHRYELNVETFRQRFRAYRYSNFDGPREAYAQLHELLLKWIQPERKTGEQILEMIALEQFIEILPDKVKLWVQEHRPETSTKAISLAEDFLLARREAEQRITVRNKPLLQKELMPVKEPGRNFFLFLQICLKDKVSLTFLLQPIGTLTLKKLREKTAVCCHYLKRL
uniref:SCAN box domain-containing protein n=1 Tax=Xenopus tropicalis TaxID=8364 RepID=A0A803JGK2_XENTR